MCVEFFTIMVSWQQGRIKGGGGGSNTPPPLKFFLGKVKKWYKDEKWMGREVVVPVNIFSGGVEIFLRGSHVGNSPPPQKFIIIF